jgi:hypothetical protein
VARTWLFDVCDTGCAINQRQYLTEIAGRPQTLKDDVCATPGRGTAERGWISSLITARTGRDGVGGENAKKRFKKISNEANKSCPVSADTSERSQSNPRPSLTD